MSKELKDVNFTDLLPESLREDDTLKPAGRALDKEIQKVNSLLDTPLLYARLDDLPGPVVDHLAWQLQILYWDLDLTLEQKRELVRRAIALHKYAGTVWAVRQAMMAVGFGDAEIMEHAELIKAWQEAGGDFIDGDGVLDGSTTLSAEAGEFEFMTSSWAEFAIRAEVADIPLIPGEQHKLLHLVDMAKPARSHLVALKFYFIRDFDARIWAEPWSANITLHHQGCRQARVAGFEILGHGCEELGGSWEDSFLDGSSKLRGQTRIDGLTPLGEPLDQGHCWQMSARLTSSAKAHAGGKITTQDTLDPDVRALEDYLDGTGDLSVETLQGNTTLNGKSDLSVEPLVRYTWDMLDGSGHLGEHHGPEKIWTSGCMSFWQGNMHYKEAI